MSDRLTAGKLLKPNGLKGFIGVLGYADDPSRFLDLKEVVLESPNHQRLEATIDNVITQAHKTLIHFRGIDSREEIARYVGWQISIRREDGIPLDEDSYYLGDLLACRVVDETRGELGEVADILSHAMQDTLDIRKPGENNLYLPFMKSCLINVDTEARVLTVRLPEGLYELYRGK